MQQSRNVKRPRRAVFLSYCRGAGSVLDLVSKAKCGHFVPARGSFNQRLEADFQRVGGALRFGIDTLTTEASQNAGRNRESTGTE